MDWQHFLTNNGIEYVTSGKNTKAGEISIKCPFCGPDDPSQHMGINLKEPKWSCWRNASHSGKKPHGLVMAILGISYAQARLVVKQYSSGDPDDLDVLADSIREGKKTHRVRTKKKTKLRFPEEFRPIKNSGVTKRFWQYLYSRGFERDDVDDVIAKYDIHCSLVGDWQDYLIFPIKRHGKLVAWQGRALTPTKKAPRYKALSEDEGALYPIKETVYNETELFLGGSLLIILEGMTDLIKFDYYSKPKGKIDTTCVFGTHMTPGQIHLIIDLSKHFKKTLLLFDTEAVDSTYDALMELETFGIEAAQLPPNKGDPGELTKREVVRLCKRLVKEHLGT